MTHRLLVMAVSSVLLVNWSPVDAVAYDFIEQQGPRTSLSESRQYVLRGERTADGCSFTYPELVLPPGVEAIEQRDIGIDLAQCGVLVEEGIPRGEFKARIGEGSSSDRSSVKVDPDSSTQRWKKGYNQVWWEDAIGGMVTSAETHGRWYYNGTCSVGGNGFFGYVGYAPTGWQPVPGSDGYSQGNTCARYQAKGWAQVKNDAFCARRVTVTYAHVTFQGSRTGVMSASHNSYQQDSCLPLFKRNRLVLVSQGTGGPL